MHCYQTICQIAKKLFVEGWQVHSQMARRVSTLHAHARFPNLTMNTLILSVTHVI